MQSIKRSKLVTIICMIGYAWVVLVFPSVFSPSIKRLGDFIPALYGFMVASTFIAFIGIWHMKRWGVHLYTSVFFIKQVFFYLINDYGMSTIFGTILSVLFIVVFLYDYKNMSTNL